MGLIGSTGASVPLTNTAPDSMSFLQGYALSIILSLPNLLIAQGLSDYKWIPCIEAITPNSLNLGISSKSICWECSILNLLLLLGVKFFS